MAETTVPTFKLVLVGDGGTGKVSIIGIFVCSAAGTTDYDITWIRPSNGGASSMSNSTTNP